MRADGKSVKNSKETGQARGRPSDLLAEVTLLRQRSLDDEQRLGAAIAGSSDGILVIDRDGRITHANDAAERMLGTSARTLPGSSCTDAFWRITAVNGVSTAEQGPTMLLRIQHAEAILQDEIMLERRDGERVPLILEACPVMDENDLISGSVIQLRHPARRDSSDEAADFGPAIGSGPRAAQTQDGIREAVGSIANDFNNILTAIIGNISLARTEVNRSDEIYKTLTYVEKASMRAKDLAHRLLMLASPGAAMQEDLGIPVEAEAVRGSGRILVMDDEEMVRHVAARILTHLGYDVELAADGSEALAMYSMALAEGKPYRVVLMDLTVHEGMGGEQAIAELRRIDPNVRSIVSTGYSTDPIITDYKRHGFKGTVMKPYEITRLSQAIHRVVEDEP